MPFATTYAVFASRRAYDFICLDDRRGEAERQDRLRAAGPDHRLRPEPPGDRGHRDLPRHAEPRRSSTPATRTRSSRWCRRSRPIDGPVYMRLLRGNVPLVLDEYDYRFELGKAKLIRDGKDALVDLVRLHDHARARGGRAAARGPGRRRRPARPDDQAARRGDDPAGGGAQRPDGDRGREPHDRRRPRRGRRRRAAARRDRRRPSGRSRCRTSSWTPAPCRRCTTATASRPRPWPRSIKGWL